VKVVGPKGEVYKTLSAGDSFGEVSGSAGDASSSASDRDDFQQVSLLLAIRRTASVFAIQHCELLCLTKVDFDEILSKFPSFASSISEYTKRTQYMFNSRRLSMLERQWKKVSSHMKAASLGHIRPDVVN
jgi:CRP-like cAMP-binding protein